MNERTTAYEIDGKTLCQECYFGKLEKEGLPDNDPVVTEERFKEKYGTNVNTAKCDGCKGLIHYDISETPIEKYRRQRIEKTEFEKVLKAMEKFEGAVGQFPSNDIYSGGKDYGTDWVDDMDTTIYQVEYVIRGGDLAILGIPMVAEREMNIFIKRIKVDMSAKQDELQAFYGRIIHTFFTGFRDGVKERWSGIEAEIGA